MIATLVPQIGDDPKREGKQKAVYQTPQQVEAANRFAKEFLKRRGMDHVTNPEDAYVAKSVGDPVVPIVGTAQNARVLATKLPDYVKLEDIKGDSEVGYYYENNDGDMVDVDPSVLNLPKFRKPMVMAGMMNGLATNNL